ncbi:MAG: endonuclease III domain-containing protein [Planctomycetota bacterium]
MSPVPRPRSKTASRRTLRAAYDRLLRAYGHRDWWPAETPLEMCVGAVLTQNAAWTNVEKALDALREAALLGDARTLRAVPLRRLETLIRPAGYFRVKARRLRNLLDWILDRGDGDVLRALGGETEEVRRDLLTVNGVGRETADSILLYAGGHAVFVIDAYTRRVVGRHGWMDGKADYDVLRAGFETRLGGDPDLYNDFHAQIVEVGKNHCAPTPRCGGCPLESVLPHGVPVAP